MIGVESQKVTIGTKVTKKEKLATKAIAEQYDMNTSQYLNALLFQQNKCIQQRLHLPDNLIIEANYQAAISERIQLIQQQFPDRTASEILYATLELALKNEKLITNNKLKKYL